MIAGYYYLKTSNCKSNLNDIREAYIKGYPSSLKNEQFRIDWGHGA